jgi:hypothetical protein
MLQLIMLILVFVYFWSEIFIFDLAKNVKI